VYVWLCAFSKERASSFLSQSPLKGTTYNPEKFPLKTYYVPACKLLAEAFEKSNSHGNSSSEKKNKQLRRTAILWCYNGKDLKKQVQ